MKPLTPTILIDTRERAPLPIRAYPTEVVGLPVGDYGVKGFSDWDNPRFIVERKTLADLVGSLTSGRERFWREIEKLRQFRFAALLIEGVRDAIEMHHYGGHATPQSLLASLDAIMVRCNVHVVWCTDADGAARELEGLVRQFCRGIEKDYRRLVYASAPAEAEAVNA